MSFFLPILNILQVEKEGRETNWVNFHDFKIQADVTAGRFTVPHCKNIM
jgi:hypothetical protein